MSQPLRPLVGVAESSGRAAEATENADSVAEDTRDSSQAQETTPGQVRVPAESRLAEPEWNPRHITRQVIEYYADLGNVQMASTIILVLWSRLSGVLDHRFVEGILWAYIGELLYETAFWYGSAIDSPPRFVAEMPPLASGNGGFDNDLHNVPSL
nr:hypothetical protein HK105_003322 [Polyrhizophydium stewartii]